MRRLDAAARAVAPGEAVALADGVTHYLYAPPAGSAVGTTPVILVHGFSVPSFVWEPTYDGLVAAGLPVLCYDLFGRGYSDRPRVRYDIALFDRQLVDLVAALALPTPVDVIGLSMGGAIAVGVADRHPDLVRRLVLIDPAGFPMRRSCAGVLARLPGLGELLMATAGRRMLLQDLAGDFSLPERLPALARRYVAQMQYAGFFRALLSTIRHGPIESMAEAYARVGRQHRRVLLIWGTEDHTVPFELSAQVLAALPNATFRPMAGCGHVPHLERPDEVNRILLDFLTAG